MQTAVVMDQFCSSIIYMYQSVLVSQPRSLEYNFTIIATYTSDYLYEFPPNMKTVNCILM